MTNIGFGLGTMGGPISHLSNNPTIFLFLIGLKRSQKNGQLKTQKQEFVFP